MTTTERAEAVALWAAGEATLLELAKKYGKDISTIKSLMSREGVKKGQAVEERKEVVQEAIQQRIASEAEEIAKRVVETKEDHYKMASGLAKLIWNEIAEARKNEKPIATAYHNVKTLKTAADALKTLRDERYTLLGIRADEDDGDKTPPELVVKELTVKDIQEMQRKAALEAADGLGVPDIKLGDEDLLDDKDPEDFDDRVEEGGDGSD
ncbi:hypothetical protein [Castellaniella sp.]|uniref:hypothetical protein n=1 Tax=Castellaniella sp. TaxID=1955812 RepID=UPI002AFDF42D|nr:hypothetical protein [Castellaniella sp.]